MPSPPQANPSLPAPAAPDAPPAPAPRPVVIPPAPTPPRFGQVQARALLDRYQSLKALRQPWETLWQDISDYVMPRRAFNAGATLAPSTQRESRLFDTTAVQANMTLANGCVAWMSPQEAPWFAFEAPQGKDSDPVRRWLSTVTERTRNALAASNYYTAQHEFYLDRSAFGTACLYVEPGLRRALNVQCWPVGSFVIDEDEEGNVDTVMREFELTARQAVQKFGKDSVSERIRKAHQAGGAKLNERFKFLHAIYPRPEAERDAARLDAPNKAFACIYLELAGAHVCKVSGYDTMPVMVSRYLEWGSGMGALYGWSPSFAALPEARQVNFLQKMMDALAEKMAFPPVMAPEELEGEIDASAGGVTYFDKTLAAAQAMPREWMTQGRYDIGMDRVKERQAAINRAFHVELFQMFSQLDKTMTAREVAERASEKLIQFSPTFSRLTVELFNPLMERLLGILLETGRIGEPPPELAVHGADGRAWLPTPQVQYSSRIALSLRAMHGVALQRTLELVASASRVDPAVARQFDWAGAIREDALNNGLPARYIRPEADVQAEMQAEAQAQMQQKQIAAATQAADMAAKVGRIPKDSAMARQIAALSAEEQGGPPADPAAADPSFLAAA